MTEVSHILNNTPFVWKIPQGFSVLVPEDEALGRYMTNYLTKSTVKGDQSFNKISYYIKYITQKFNLLKEHQSKNIKRTAGNYNVLVHRNKWIYIFMEIPP